MTRLHKYPEMKLRILPAAALLLIALSVTATSPSPAARAFSLEYKATVSPVPSGAKRLELWVPVPHGDPFQTITGVSIDSPYPYTESTDSAGNLMLHVAVDNPGQSAVTLTMHVKATRIEHLQPALSGGPKPDHDLSPAELAPYLRPDRLVPLDDNIRKMAREVVETANAQTDLEMARAIYNHVVATVKYDKTGKGWGRGDIYYACEARRGNCTDFHAIFIGFARAVGIPARFSIGFPLPAARGQGKIAGYHCWAEFYAKGIGWVPIDASEAAKNPSKREYFFGAHDENRLEFTRGRDLILSPRQKDEPLNYFIHPYVEVDDKAFAGVVDDITFQDAKSE
jgi:transglutaminase-like putative cysteine protease